jgi:hypothetical protein
MRLFSDKGPDRQDPQRIKRETRESVREQQYLQRLSHMLEHGIPTHRAGSDAPQSSESPAPSPPPRKPAERTESAPEPVRTPTRDESLRPTEMSPEDPFITLPGASESALGEFSFGDIVLLGDDSIGLYNRFIPEKEYDVVYLLEADGSLSPKGVLLSAHGGQTIGRLPATMARRCFSQMAWDRDLIVFHLYEFSDTKRVPHPTVARNADGKVVTKHHAAETPQEEVARERTSPLTRGRRFSVSFGDRTWEAIAWGHDEQGALVAHNTTGEWALMHLDLRRFEGAIQFRELLSREELAEIERALLASTGSGEGG